MKKLLWLTVFFGLTGQVVAQTASPMPAGAPDPTGDWRVEEAKNGKMYDSNVTLTSPTALKVQGCVLGLFCGGETWTKVAEAAGTTAPTAPATKGRKPAGGAATAGNGASAGASSVNVCASVASGAVPRLAH